jgi:hypothetical protein
VSTTEVRATWLCCGEHTLAVGFTNGYVMEFVRYRHQQTGLWTLREVRVNRRARWVATYTIYPGEGSSLRAKRGCKPEYFAHYWAMASAALNEHHGLWPDTLQRAESDRLMLAGGGDGWPPAKVPAAA